MCAWPDRTVVTILPSLSGVLVQVLSARVEWVQEKESMIDWLYPLRYLWNTKICLVLPAHVRQQKKIETFLTWPMSLPGILLYKLKSWWKCNSYLSEPRWSWNFFSIEFDIHSVPTQLMRNETGHEFLLLLAENSNVAWNSTPIHHCFKIAIAGIASIHCKL